MNISGVDGDFPASLLRKKERDHQSARELTDTYRYGSAIRSTTHGNWFNIRSHPKLWRSSDIFEPH